MHIVACTPRSEQGFTEVIGHGEMANILGGGAMNGDMESFYAPDSDPPQVCLGESNRTANPFHIGALDPQ